MLLGGCWGVMGGVGEVVGGVLDGVCEVSGGVGCCWAASGRLLGGVWEVAGRCLGDALVVLAVLLCVRDVSGRCLYEACACCMCMGQTHDAILCAMRMVHMYAVIV